MPDLTGLDLLTGLRCTSFETPDILRLRRLNDPVAADAFLPTFMADYNQRFAQPPRVAHDAHRALHANDDLARIFTLQDTRQIGRQLTVHYTWPQALARVAELNAGRFAG